MKAHENAMKEEQNKKLLLGSKQLLAIGQQLGTE
jgi:hypothetical protein